MSEMQERFQTIAMDGMVACNAGAIVLVAAQQCLPRRSTADVAVQHDRL